MKIALPDAEATTRLGQAVAPLLAPGDSVLLYGPLGMGKSTLARGLIRALTTPDEDVPSPTFTLVQFYDGDPPVAHFDLYRLTRPDEAFEIGLDEALDEGCAIIEWPERLGDDPGRFLGPDRLVIHLSEIALDPHSERPQAAELREPDDRASPGRLATVSGVGAWEARLKELHV
jgi:tRNA threonylcarbamoyladenosine biosynthesis protein TsaE